jgi:hypothetical protein
MNDVASSGAVNPVAQAFASDCIVIPLSSLLPVKSIPKNVKSSHKYRQITASVEEIGLVEPPVVARNDQDSTTYLLLDGHLRVEVLKDLGKSEVECLLSTDDEAFTYNKRVSRLSAIQEQRMIARAIERKVPKEKLARALNIGVGSVDRKIQLLDGICSEAVALLKDKMCPMAIFDILRKMGPLRQLETAELMINANNFAVSYASAILIATPQSELADPHTPKRMKGMTTEAIGRMEKELARLQEAIESISETYGQDHLHLTVVKGYVGRLVENHKISQYLAKHQPEFLSEFQRIANLTSSLPGDVT